MDARRLAADEQLLGDLAVRPALCHERQDLVLAGGEVGERRAGVAAHPGRARCASAAPGASTALEQVPRADVHRRAVRRHQRPLQLVARRRARRRAPAPRASARSPPGSGRSSASQVLGRRLPRDPGRVRRRSARARPWPTSSHASGSGSGSPLPHDPLEAREELVVPRPVRALQPAARLRLHRGRQELRRRLPVLLLHARQPDLGDAAPRPPCRRARQRDLDRAPRRMGIARRGCSPRQVAGSLEAGVRCVEVTLEDERPRRARGMWNRVS